VRVEVAEDLPEAVESLPARSAATFDPGASGRIEYQLLARRRGKYTLDRLYVRVLPAMGLLTRQFIYKEPSAVDVYPNLVNIGRYKLMLRRGLTHEQGLARLRQVAGGSEFESLRVYGEGDDFSQVDWKATAKRAQLIVRNRQPERQQSVLVAIDVGRATAGEFAGLSRLDYFVNAALMLAYVVLRQGDWFSLLAFSDRIESYLPPVRREGSVGLVARALYELQPKLVESDYSGACRFLGLRSRRRSLVCLMTDIIDRDASASIIDYMARFARRHLPLAVTLSDPGIAEMVAQPMTTADPYLKAAAVDVTQAREEALAQMRRRAVNVLSVPPAALTVGLVNRYLEIKAARRL
jgi:uncharacterized protein (DUF58 family)